MLRTLLVKACDVREGAGLDRARLCGLTLLAYEALSY
jgi:hypothetical protein